MLPTEFEDLQEVLINYNRAIDCCPNASDYNDRGLLKACKLQDMYGGLTDFDRAIQLDPKNADAYVNRGLLRNEILGDRAGGIADMQQAARLYQQQDNTKDHQVILELIKYAIEELSLCPYRWSSFLLLG